MCDLYNAQCVICDGETDAVVYLYARDMRYTACARGEGVDSSASAMICLGKAWLRTPKRRRVGVTQGDRGGPAAATGIEVPAVGRGDP